MPVLKIKLAGTAKGPIPAAEAGLSGRFFELGLQFMYGEHCDAADADIFAS